MHCDLDLTPFDPKVDRADPWLTGSVPVKFHEDRCKGEAVMRMEPFYLTMRLQTDGRMNRVAGGITMTTGEWSCLISFARATPTGKEVKRAKNSKWKYMPPQGIEPVTLWFLAGHLDRLAIETVHYLCFKLLQYSEVTGNAWGVSKHVAIQLIKVLKLKCKQL